MGKLRNLSVERTDAVDRPATGRQWIIVKAEDADTADSGAELRDAAVAAIDELAKGEVALTDEARAAFEALAGLLGVSFEAKAVDEDAGEAEADEADEDGDEGDADAGDDDAGEVEASAPDDELAKRLDGIEATLAKLAESIADRPVAKSGGRSKQLADPGREIRKGEGVFENIIFGPVSQLS